MSTKLYEELTREDVQQLCDLYNQIDSMLGDAGETLDIVMMLQDLYCTAI